MLNLFMIVYNNTLFLLDMQGKNSNTRLFRKKKKPFNYASFSSSYA